MDPESSRRTPSCLVSRTTESKQKSAHIRVHRIFCLPLLAKLASMYRLKEFWQSVGWPLPHEDWDGNLVCLEGDAQTAYDTNRTQGHVLCYSFTLVTGGRMSLHYNDQVLTLGEGSLYTYSPGFPVSVLEVSDDYRAFSLLADEEFTLALPGVRHAIGTGYFPLVRLQQPCLDLSPDEYRHLRELMQLAIRYRQTNPAQSRDSLRMLYGLFLNDLNAIQERNTRAHRLPKRVEEIFLNFAQLLPRHFMEHHDIGFYADRLCITPTYLSRIVRQVSGGRTVMSYIDQMLAMEAVFLLRHSSLSVAQIAEQLHFADTTTFARFFARMKGITPKQYRMSGQTEREKVTHTKHTPNSTDLNP